MDIKLLAAKLRRAADVLDDLAGIDVVAVKRNENPTTAAKIIKAAARPNKKPHWSQTPEGKRKLHKIMKAKWAAKRRNAQL